MFPRFPECHPVTGIASAIRLVEPWGAAKLLARDLGISLRHAKRIVAGEIPQSREDEVCRWLAKRLDRKLDELARLRGEITPPAG